MQNNLQSLIAELDDEIKEIEDYNELTKAAEALLGKLDKLIPSEPASFNEETISPLFENICLYFQEPPEFRATIHQVIKWQGLDIGLEYKPGDIRFRGTGYERKLRHGYGHIRNYKGADSEAIDCYLSPDFFNEAEPTNLIFEVSQLSPEDGDFDEHKFMLGFESLEQAKSAYLQEMSRPFFGGIKEVDIEDLEQYRKSKPSFNEEVMSEDNFIQVDGTVLSEKEYNTIASIDEKDIAAALNNWKKVAPDAYGNLLQANFTTSIDYAKYFDAIIPEFAAVKMFGQSNKKKKCVKGFACGNGCLPIKTKSGKDTQCRNPLEGQAKTYAEFLKLQKKNKKASTKNSGQKLNKSNDLSAGIHSIKKQEDFDKAVSYIISELSKEHQGAIPIYKVRRALGETISRDKFNEFLQEMQSNDKILLYTGEAREMRSDKMKREDSITNLVGGIRYYIKPQDGLDKLSETDTMKYSKYTKNPPPLDEIGSAREIQKRAKIKSQKEFNSDAAEAYQKLNEEFNEAGLVSLSRLRKVFEGRVAPDEFDSYIKQMTQDTNYKLSGAAFPDEDQKRTAVKPLYGDDKHYLTLER